MYQRIPLSCECGREPGRLREIGLTADRQLVVYWRCSQCRKHVYIVKSLADYWRECPSHGSKSEREAIHRISDEQFLRSVGIRVTEDQQAETP